MYNLSKVVNMCLRVLVSFIFFACQESMHEESPIAQVGERFLYGRDITRVIPDNMSPTDSMLWVADYIKKWIRSELLILKAEQSLSFEQKNVDKELNEYRNSLLTYRYKNELISQKMDTVITQSQIDSYYEKNKHNFVLQNHVVKAVFLKIPLEAANPETIRNLVVDDNPQKQEQLDEYGLRYAKTYDRFGDKWINAEDVLSQLPEIINDEERFLRKNKFIESSDTDYYYFICIRDFRVKGQNAPIPYVQTDIKNILLNQRKIKFLRDVEDDIYKEGIASSKFRIFNNSK